MELSDGSDKIIHAKAEDVLIKGIQAYEDVVSHCPHDNDDFTHYQETIKDAKRALQYKQECRVVKLLTRHQSTSSMSRTTGSCSPALLIPAQRSHSASTARDSNQLSDETVSTRSQSRSRPGSVSARSVSARSMRRTQSLQDLNQHY